MRIATFFLSSVLLLAACADSSEPTAPGSRAAAKASAVPSAQADLPPGPGLKPVDQVGWTQAATVYSDVVIPAGSNLIVQATCPAGTTATGGGFWFVYLPTILVVPPLVHINAPDAAGTKWTVGATNFASNTGAALLRAYVRCAS